MNRAEYDAIQAVNWSTLKHLRRSPAHYRHVLEHGVEDTPAMALGRAVHCAVLEPDQLTARYVVWSGGRRQGRAWDEFKAGVEADGREVLDQKDLARCLAIQGAVRSHPAAHAVLSMGEPEKCLQWTDTTTGLPCKGLVDWIGTDGQRPVLVDLKTSRDASPSGFSRAAYRLMYHGQFAFYRQGWRELHVGEADPRVVAIAAEPVPPWAVAVYDVGDDVLGPGLTECMDLLGALKIHRAADKWPAYGDTPILLQLPPWAAFTGGREEEDGEDW